MCRAVGLRLKSVSVDTGDWFVGQTTHVHPVRRARHTDAEDRARLDLEKDVLICVAGALAQRRYARGRNDDGGAIDTMDATKLAQTYFRSATTAAAYVAFATEWARQILAAPAVWAAVERLAGALRKEGSLGGKRAEQIIGGPNAALTPHRCPLRTNSTRSRTIGGAQ